MKYENLTQIIVKLFRQKNDLLLHSDSLPLVTPSIPLGIAFELALQQ
ncbi:unnamed protein product [Acanthoscelides obtectus]|uniref:Uncharacterized protein n=1 Tax=Acanthoscelides obtectus TaxID=200917 RepID=A0A9P0PSQ2_ACAOB|nr:unnamed protein product [Acanthoscelides obtectus]CAK1670132.1 hypothetical protein AOBTE_LOCUS27421 [Acanthoscelides obtectus]